MAIKKYSNKNCDLDVLFQEIETWFVQRNYEIQKHQDGDARLIQATQDEAWRVAAGASRAFNVELVGEPNDFSVELSTGAWATNLAAGGVTALLTGGATLLISGATIGWSKKIEADISEYIDQRVQFGVKASGTSGGTPGSSSEKLRHLREAFDGGILTQQEFDAKKAEIERANDAGPKAAAGKLEAALAAGVLTREEYELKKAELQKNQASAARLKALEDAREAGILSDAEFEAKKAALI